MRNGLYSQIVLKKDFIFERKIAALTEHELHMHDLLEVSILLENKVRYRLSDRDAAGEPGDIFIFRPFEAHWNLADSEDSPAVWIMLLFSPSVVRALPQGCSLLAPFYTMEWNPLIPSVSEEARLIRQAACSALQEQQKMLPGWEMKQFLYMADILVQIFRYFMLQQSHERQAESIEGIVRSIEYLLGHFAEWIDMTQVIELSGMKKTWFYKQFHMLTGLTPNEFVNKLRLQYAIHLLKHSDKTVTDIAFECGFHSVSYFNKLFKDTWLLTPRTFRNHAQ
ncbi:AraC family transcriptional regulator [Paenibacillus sp. H1-7]|uniref:helix-turn-helix transcriptional regulator n=1 Tax=Paenibacillus sp. H1-7 TaxID=2282849 RepID=UPI001EF88C5B|nr:AraC family transcriptional regulator [Paenibacillus sp. H1-7]ULL14962.1 AraC family transcriptional regulator [Paenibacillus sp. H1-7]